MFSNEQYELVDFGRGRKLERFGPCLVDRPCPAASRQRWALPDRWAKVDARFEKQWDDRENWTSPMRLPPAWTIRYGNWGFELRPTPFGHLGIFPEQAENWDWLVAHLRTLPPGLRVLNLFAYTGGSSIAAATAGAQVVHVDAAKNVVAWARRNAALSGLSDAPIRWISEDARLFVKRELRRGVRYDALILDPPSYGHGPQGQAWKIQQHLEPLLRDCGQLLHDTPSLILLTCHTPGQGLADLQRLVSQTCIRQEPHRIEAKPLKIPSTAGRSLPSGIAIRWTSQKTNDQ